MISSEMSKAGQVRLRIEGDIKSLIVECHAICTAIAELFKDEQDIEKFIDYLPEDVRTYRSLFTDRVTANIDVINKAKENLSNDTL